MKRMSALAIAVLVVLPSLAEGYSYYYVPVRYRTRYSPYAFSHDHPSGLIPGHLRYSPYAFGHGSTGLVPYWFRYSPYAYGSKHPSGLISDYWYGPYYAHCTSDSRHSGSVGCDSSGSACTSGRESAELLYYKMKQKHEENLTARDERIRRLKKDRQAAKAGAKSDGGELIRQYLRGKNIEFQMNRLLRIDNSVLSVDFLLTNKNLLIKYWNPEDIECVVQESGYKKNVYERYRQMWSKFGEQFERTGGKIYHIESANAQEILDQLGLCDRLNAG